MAGARLARRGDPHSARPAVVGGSFSAARVDRGGRCPRRAGLPNANRFPVDLRERHSCWSPRYTRPQNHAARGGHHRASTAVRRGMSGSVRTGFCWLAGALQLRSTASRSHGSSAMRAQCVGERRPFSEGITWSGPFSPTGEAGGAGAVAPGVLTATTVSRDGVAADAPGEWRLRLVREDSRSMLDPVSGELGALQVRLVEPRAQCHDLWPGEVRLPQAWWWGGPETPLSSFWAGALAREARGRPMAPLAWSVCRETPRRLCYS